MQSMTIKSDLREVSQLAEWLRQLLTNQIMAEQVSKQRVISQLELLMVEAVNNVVEHGYAGDCHQSIDVTVAIHTDRIILKIIDQGKPPPTADAYLNANLPAPESLPESGWGIGLINTIADQIEVERIGNVNTSTLTKYYEMSDDTRNHKTPLEV